MKNLYTILFFILTFISFHTSVFAQSPLDQFLESLNTSSTISGRVYLDTNGNGTQDIDENGIENVTMLIINSNNTGQFAVTDGNGDWSISIIPGNTQVFAAINSLPVGVIQTEGTNPTILNVPDQSDDENPEPIDIGSYGFFFVGNLQGNLYRDINGNGTQDIDEPGIEEVEILLTDQFGNIQSVLTNEDGEWEFQIGAGEVISNINQNDPNFPTGAFQTEGTDPTTTFINAGETIFAENDGFFEAGIIEGIIYNDTNGNGQQDPGENGIANIEVQIETSLGTTITLITDENGNWTVTAPIGETTVTIDENQANFPIGATQTQGINPTVYDLEIAQIYQQVDGFYQSGILEGRIYLDDNANGVQDAAENGIENVDVAILKSTGETETVTSDIDGNWSIEVPIGETISTINTTAPNFPLLFIQTEGNNPTTSNIITNQTLSEFDGFAEAAEIIGTVYNDLNGNGNQDVDENGFGGIEVSIEDEFGNTQIVTTNADGSWSVLVLTGNVSVSIDENQPGFPDNAILTEGVNPFNLLAEAGETYTANFGYFILEEETAEINGRVYLDSNGNSTQDATEVGIANIDIEIIDGDNNITIVETDSNGDFSTIVTSGTITYTIDENDPDFPIGTIQTEGTNPTTLVTNEGESNFVGNNGYFIPDQNTNGNLNARVYLDANANGTQDATENGIPNVDVTVTDNFGNTQTLTTNADGDFSASVIAGLVTYEIDENDPDFPAAATQTEGTNPTTLFVQPNATTFGGNNGFFVPDTNISSTLEAHLYLDTNGDGTQQATEPDLPNIDVEIIDFFGNNQIVETDVNGDISATVIAGDVIYIIDTADVDFPTGAFQTEGTNPTSVFVIPETNTFGGNNGFFVPNQNVQSTLSIHLYIDENGNGTQDATESDLPNVEVTFTDFFNGTQELESDANGDITLTMVSGNVSYLINEADPDFPAGAIQTEGTNPTNLFLPPNVSIFGGNNGFFVPDQSVQASINAHLYFDENGNGSQQANEPTMPNVEVEIVDFFGNTQIIETDVNGDFTANVVAGNVIYTINENDPDFPTGAVQTEGSNPTLVFVAPNSNTFGGNNGFFDFSQSENQGAVSGIVYFDENGNGTQDATEEGIENIDVTLEDENGIITNLTTGINGQFSSIVEAGNVSISINENDPDFPIGAIQTEGVNPNIVIVTAGNTTNSGSYGYFIPDQSVITSATTHVYIDENGNGTQDAGELDLANIDVNFTDFFGNTITQATDNNGNASVDIPAGSVTVFIDEDDVDFPAGAIQTEGTNPNTIIALAGQDNFEGDNGYFVPDNSGGDDDTILSAHLYNDLNANGTQDINEPDLENVAVEILDNDGVTQNLTTNANGDFSVVVAVGNVTYTIDENDLNLPNNAVQTEGTNPTTLLAVANQNNFGGNNGFFEPNQQITTNLLMHIYLDANGNGEQDAGEANIPNILVEFTDALGITTTESTNINGEINIEIPAGAITYLIDEDDADFPADAIQTEGTNPTSLLALTGVLNDGGSNGYFVPDPNENETIFSTHVYLDANGNGDQDAGEINLENVEVIVEESDGNLISLFTNALGNISTPVLAGEITYTINENSPGIPNNAVQTEGTNPTTLIVNVGENNFGGDNGYFVPEPSGGNVFVISHLYFDDNGNGDQDSTEPDMENVEVFVSVSGVSQSFITDANGNIIAEVPAGEITININELDPNFPTGAIQTEGTNPSTFTVNEGVTLFAGNNGFFLDESEDPTLITGHIYLDENGNATQDNAEPDLPNIDVIITDSQGNQQTVQTNPNGDFVANVSAGNLTYLIDEDDPDFPADAIQTEGTNPTTVNITEGIDNFGGNNGFFVLDPSDGNAFVSTHLYFDDNGNGDQEATELDMVDVEVFVSSNGITQSFFTDAIGNIIAEVPAGEITININELDPNFPTGATQTEGTNPTTFNVNEGDVFFAGDNGFFIVNDVSTTLFGHLYLDENANGTQDANEPNLPDVDVTISDSSGTNQIVTTNPNGDFLSNVEAGDVTYQIDETSTGFPAGAVQTEGTNPTTINALEGDNNFGGNNGFFVPTGLEDAFVFGHIYEDLNGNGIQNVGEPDLENIEVEIVDQAGTTFILITDNNGDFETELASGLAIITINENDPNFPTNAIQTEGTNPTSILLAVNENTDAGNFGYFSEEDGGPVDEDGIEIFNAISPNGDGRNEFFRIEGLSNFPNNTVKIFNRSGIKVFETNNYGFGGNVFRGISEGRISIQENKSLPTGTYFYILEYENEDGQQKRKQGYLYLN